MKVEGVVIAAGKSSRMSPDHKLLLDLDGRTVIERCIDSLDEFCSRIIVVTGHNAQLITESIENINKLVFIHNKAYEEGMFSSIKAGFGAAEGDRVFYIPADCPFVKREVFLKMLSVNADIVVPSFDGSYGHPVLFSIKEARRIREDTSSESLREYMEKSSLCVVKVNDPGILWDIDTPEDYIKALKYFKQSGR